jgi:hypothetical protein
MQLSEACRLYRAALQVRRDAYRTHRKSLNYYDQADQLKQIRDGGGLALPNYHCAQDVLKRVEKTFQAFFGRIKKRQKPGFPRFKSARRYDSITFPSCAAECCARSASSPRPWRAAWQSLRAQPAEWESGYLSRGHGGFQNSGKGFLNLHCYFGFNRLGQGSPG